jgi:hypothetical protein
MATKLVVSLLVVPERLDDSTVAVSGYLGDALEPSIVVLVDERELS